MKVLESSGTLLFLSECPYCKTEYIVSEVPLSSPDNIGYGIHHCHKVRQDVIDRHKNIFIDIYKKVMTEGTECAPRGLRIKELEDFCFMFPPYVRFVNFECRKFKLDYVKREFLWYLRGDKYDSSICKYAKMWKKFINFDGSINSNYGQYFFGIQNQFMNAANTLLKDKESRRASMIVLQPYHLLFPYMKEVPCTYSINFRIRNDRLNMSVHMRSQDAVIGLASDLPIFSFIQEMMCVYLRKKYQRLELGTYFHNVDSFHIYEKHFSMISKIIHNESEYNFIRPPFLFTPNEVEFMVSGRIFSDKIPSEYLFSRWLMEVYND